MTIEITDKDVLLIIDMINDFVHPKGSLFVKGGNLIIPGINKLASKFKNVVIITEWHPAGHEAFASTHDAEPFSIRKLTYGDSVLWPDHGVQNTWGAEFHPDIKPSLDSARAIFRKGMDPMIHSYSAFYEDDRITTTGLTGFLRHLDIKRVFSTGVAYDYCVGYGGVDAVRDGFESYIIQDLSGSIALPTSKGRTTVDDIEDEFKRVGVHVITSEDF